MGLGFWGGSTSVFATHYYILLLVSPAMRLPVFFVAAAAVALPTVIGGPLTYALCQTACNAGVVTCYAGAGLTFGTVVAAAAAPAAAIACNTVLGVCMGACAASFLAPTP